MSNSLREQLAASSLAFFSQGELQFCILCRSRLVTGENSSASLKLFTPIPNLKLKKMVFLSKLVTLMVGVHLGCPFSMLLYISASIKYFQLSLMPTGGL